MDYKKKMLSGFVCKQIRGRPGSDQSSITSFGFLKTRKMLRCIFTLYCIENNRLVLRTWVVRLGGSKTDKVQIMIKRYEKPKGM